MASASEQIRSHIGDLLTTGRDFHALTPFFADKEEYTDSDGLAAVRGRVDHTKLVLAYEPWFTKAQQIIRLLVPNRLGDFEAAYRPVSSRKELTYGNYTILDFLKGLSRTNYAGVPVFDSADAYRTQLTRQIAIVKAAHELCDTVLLDITSALRAELLDADLRGAHELVDAGHLRAAGIVAGISLEVHLRHICTRRLIDIKKRKPTLSDFNDAIKEAGVIEVTTWRKIQHLGDIRNVCAHAKEQAPSIDDIKDLLRGVDAIIKTVF